MAAAFGGCANKPSVLAKRRPAPARSFSAHGRNGDAEFGGDAPSRLLALRRDGPYQLVRFIQYRGWRCLRCAAVEGRLRRIDHVKLDGLCSLVAAQLGGEAQGAIDASRDTG